MLPFLDMKHMAGLIQRSCNWNRNYICANNFSLLAEGLGVVILRTSATDGFLFVG